MKVSTIPQNMSDDLYIAAKQVSQEVIVGKDFQIENGLTYLDENSQETTIIMDNHRLVKKPGFEIFAFHIDKLSFYIKNDFIYMMIGREDKTYTFLIGSQ